MSLVSPIPAAAIVLIAMLTSAHAADDLGVRVDENLAGGRPVADVRALPSLDEQARASLTTESKKWFRLDDAGATLRYPLIGEPPSVRVDSATGERLTNVPASPPAVENRSSLHTLGWVVWSFVATGVLIIISTRLREPAELPLPPDRLTPYTSEPDPQPLPASIDHLAAPSPVAPVPSVSSPTEIESVLARLGESFGETGSVVEEPVPPEEDRPGGGSGIDTVDELMTRVLSAAGLLDESEPTGDRTTAPSVAAAQTATAEPPLMIGEGFAVPGAPSTVQQSASPSANVDHPMRRRTDDVAKTERHRIEEFRKISRRSSQAEIIRCHRERMREQWMSVGVTALASLITGTVCVVSRCLAEMSLPIGCVLISVGLILLMRPSLYPPPRRRATDFLDDRGLETRRLL